MSENTPQSPPTPEKDDPRNQKEHYKEIRALLWMGIVSVWIILGLLIFIGSGNYRNALQIRQLSESQQFTKILDAMDKSTDQTKKDLAKSVNRTEKSLSRITNDVRKELKVSTDRMDNSLKKVLEDQKALSRKMREDMTESGKRMSEALDKLMSAQQGLMDEVQRSNTYDAEKRKAFQRFFEAQSDMLEDFSDLFGDEADGEEKDDEDDEKEGEQKGSKT